MRSSSHTHQRAKSLRATLSPPEAALWARLRARSPGQLVFRRQHPIGPYVADFYCSEARLVIEIDGADHGTQRQRRHDEERDAWMRARGYIVLRYPAGEVLRDPDEAALSIWTHAMAASAERAALRPLRQTAQEPSATSPVKPSTGGGEG
jgi:very-short-patch-repair endonuclease